MVQLTMGHCIECFDPVWQKPHELRVCHLCKRGRELSEAYGEGEAADRWVLVMEGAVALGTKKRWENRSKFLEDKIRWA